MSLDHTGIYSTALTHLFPAHQLLSAAVTASGKQSAVMGFQMNPDRSIQCIERMEHFTIDLCKDCCVNDFYCAFYQRFVFWLIHSGRENIRAVMRSERGKTIISSVS